MLLDEKLRKQFTVSILSGVSQVGSSLKTYLALSGYQVTLTNSEPDYLKSLEAADLAHVSIIELSAIKNLNKLLESQLSINPESTFLIIGPSSLSVKIEGYRQFGVCGLIPVDDGIEAQALMQTDMICSELFLKYQNEQLLDQVKEVKSKFDSQVSELNSAVSQMGDRAEGLSHDWVNERAQLQTQIDKLGFELAQQKEANERLLWLSRPLGSDMEEAILRQGKDSVASFFIHLSATMSPEPWRGYYFRFMPEVQAFLLTQYEAEGDTKSWNSLTFRSGELAPAQIIQKIRSEQSLPDLEKFLVAELSLEKYKLYALEQGGSIDGFFCFSYQGASSEVIVRRLDSEFALFKQIHFNRKLAASSASKGHAADPVSQFEMRDAYFEKLNAEFARSRRLSHPICVVKIAIDSFDEILSIHQKNTTDLLLAQTAQLVRASSRVNDYAFRTDENEFALILPHTPVKGAAIRAERLRRIIEMHEFVGYEPGHLTVCLGISEYPELVDTVEDLDLSATRALQFIRAKAMNKVCLYKPEAGSSGG